MSKVWSYRLLVKCRRNKLYCKMERERGRERERREREKGEGYIESESERRGI